MHTEPSCLAQANATETELELWNPAAITLWSVLLSPAFGAWLQMYNLRRMGQEAQAAVARRWCVASLWVLGCNALFHAINIRLGGTSFLFDWVNLSLFIVWCTCNTPQHAQAVRARCGSTYRKRAWDNVLAIGALCALAYLCTSTLLGWTISTLT